MRASTIASVFRAAWSTYCQDAVEVHLVPSPRTCPIRGFVAWGSSKSWVVGVRWPDDPETTWARLFHELHHVLVGDATKGGKPMADVMLGWLKGDASVGGFDYVSRTVQDAVSEAGQPAEVAAWDFAGKEAVKWWPMVVAVDAAISQGIQQGVQEWQGQRNRSSLTS